MSRHSSVGHNLLNKSRKDPYSIQRDFASELMREYRRYAERSPSDP